MKIKQILIDYAGRLVERRMLIKGEMDYLHSIGGSKTFRFELLLLRYAVEEMKFEIVRAVIYARR